MKKNLKFNSNLQKISEYKEYRNKLNKIITQTKNIYYKNKIIQNSNNVKKNYNLISEATNEINNKSNEIIHLSNENNKLITDSRDVANQFNNYFINIGQRMAETITIPPNPIKIKNTCYSSMFLNPVTQNEVIKYISSLKNNCSPGIDEITTKIIKAIHVHIAEPLTHIINLILETGKVPDQFKTSIVTPIHKAGSKSLTENYRPISLISNLGKIFEKCLKDRLTDFLDRNNILSANQFGFTSGLSTADAMCELTNEITTNLNNGLKCFAVFLDLSKAFDTVSHPILMDVLESYGIRGNALNIFKNYLTNRTQYTRINQTLSEPNIIKMGVPQGTVLGPILFNIYLNAMSSLTVNGKIVSYADDTVIVFNDTSWQRVKDKFVGGILTIKHFLDSFRLSLNLKKTKYMAFSITDKNRPNYGDIQIDNLSDPIEEVSTIKYLGIIIDNNLKWHSHILYLTKKVRFLIHKFYLLREFLSKKLMIMIYKALVEQLLRYGILVWGGCTLQILNL